MRKIIKLQTTVMKTICRLWIIWGVLVGALGATAALYTISSYHCVGKNVYPSSGIWAVFEDVRSPSECGAMVRGVPTFFFSKTARLCVSAGNLNSSQLLVTSGFYYYQLKGLFLNESTLATTSQNGLETSSDAPISTNVTSFQACNYANLGHSNNWFSSKDDCEAMNGYLVELDTKYEADFVLANIIQSLPAWLGAIRNGSWFSLGRGGPVVYTDWMTGYPQNVSGEDCLVWATAGWTDAPCDKHLKEVICETDVCPSN